VFLLLLKSATASHVGIDEIVFDSESELGVVVPAGSTLFLLHPLMKVGGAGRVQLRRWRDISNNSNLSIGCILLVQEMEGGGGWVLHR
jgi:hypothetical protein